MMHTYSKQIKYIIWFSLIWHVVTAFFSVGYFHADEHFQILEFANRKLGLMGTENDLAWEYYRHIRPSIQVWLVVCFGKAMLWLNMYNPLYLAFLLRLIGAVGGWYASVLIYGLTEKYFKTDFLKKYYVFILFWLWIIPAYHARFSGEAIGGMLLVFGIYQIFKKPKPYYLLAGIFIGLSMVVRLQMVFAIAGLGLWLIVYYRKNTIWWKLILGGVAALVLGYILDAVFYNDFKLITQWKYFEVNFIENVAANFGTMPWYGYFKLIFRDLVPPTSILFIAFILVSIPKSYKTVWFWILTPFFVMHSATAHKELRFLFPMLYYAPVLALYFFYKNENQIQYYATKRWYKIILWAVIVSNSLLLVYESFKPANDLVPGLEKIYNLSKKEPIIVLYYDIKPIKARDVALMNFYYNPNTIFIPYQLFDFDKKRNKKVYYFSEKKYEETNLKGHKLELVFASFPDFVKYFNFNNWMSRSLNRRLYLVQ